MRIGNVLVIYKRTAYEVLTEDERDARMLQLLSESHFTVQDLLKSHQEHRETMERVGTALEELKVSNRFQRRAEMREVAASDLIITIGGDGTFLDTSHHVRDRPMLGVNSSPAHSVGVFCAATGRTFKAVLAELLKGGLKPTTVNRMGILLNGTALAEPVLNEILICAQNPATTARYVLEIGKKREHQKSSGLYVGPAAGSTAAIRAAGGKVLPIDSKSVQYVVREPYRGPSAKMALLRGPVPPKAGLKVSSKMRTGMVYLDGAHVRYRFDIGDEIQVLPEHVPLLVYGVGKRHK